MKNEGNKQLCMYIIMYTPSLHLCFSDVTWKIKCTVHSQVMSKMLFETLFYQHMSL